MRRLDASCRYFYPDGSGFTFYHDRQKLMRELSEQGFAEWPSIGRRLAAAREAYELSAPVFLFNDFRPFTQFNTPPYRRIAANPGKLDFLRTMHGANRATSAIRGSSSSSTVTPPTTVRVPTALRRR